jgi:hypothetical protein
VQTTHKNHKDNNLINYNIVTHPNAQPQFYPPGIAVPNYSVDPNNSHQAPPLYWYSPHSPNGFATQPAPPYPYPILSFGSNPHYLPNVNSFVQFPGAPEFASTPPLPIYPPFVSLSPNPTTEKDERDFSDPENYECILDYRQIPLIYKNSNHPTPPLSLFENQRTLKIEISTYNLVISSYKLNGNLCIVKWSPNQRRRTKAYKFCSATNNDRFHSGSLLIVIAPNLFELTKTTAYCRRQKEKFVLVLFKK